MALHEFYDNFVDGVVSNRKDLAGIISCIYKGDENALHELDRTVYSETHDPLFILNAKMMSDTHPRHSGDPYFVHPASVGYIVSQLLGPRQEEVRNTAVGYAYIHDLIEKALHYDTERFLKLRRQLEQYADQFDAAVLLCPPHADLLRPYTPHQESHLTVYQKVATVLQVKKYGNQAHALTLIGDKLDSQLEFDYLNDDPNQKLKIALWFIAYPLFAIEQVTSKIPSQFRRNAERITWETAERNNIPEFLITDHRSYLELVVEESGRRIQKASDRHLKMFDHPNADN